MGKGEDGEARAVHDRHGFRSDKQASEREGLEMFVSLPEAVLITAIFGLFVLVVHVGIWMITDGQCDPEEHLEDM
jgi:hypothetical protein